MLPLLIGGYMTISFDRIKDYQERFMMLNHSKENFIFGAFTHDELNELIEILGNLLYFMVVSHKEEI